MAPDPAGPALIAEEWNRRCSDTWSGGSDPLGSLPTERVRDPATIELLRERYGLDEPLPVQYVRYLDRLAHGDLGEDFVQRRPVADIIGPKLANTAKLAVAKGLPRLPSGCCWAAPFITEAIFNWDGIGLALVAAIGQQNNRSRPGW